MATILLIEDDAELRENLRDELAAVGHLVVEAADGIDGLARFAKRRPDLVITDIVMRDKDGIEVLLAIRKEADPVPVIVISGRPEYVAMSHKLGAAHALVKPFRLPELLACVENAVAD
ncbi:MAG: response regulator [Rhodospirillales bacterium]|nr:response regulator [Rhodospirillales bacterium]